MIGIPRTPLLLGLAGLIPFVWGMATSIYQVTWASDLFVGHGVLADYGMVILSFMSGVIWGFATRATGRQANLLYVLSVIPALWAFLFAFGEYMLLTLAAGFLFILPIDIVATRAGLAPPWWAKLRVILTAVVVPCLVIGYIEA